MSCQKDVYDFSSKEAGSVDKFFDCTTRAPIVDGVINFLKVKNDSLDFVPKFVDKYGMPSWDHSVYLEEDNKYLLVPFNKSTKKEIEGIWVFTLLPNNYIHSIPIIKQKANERDYWTFDYFTCDVLKKKPASGLVFEDVVKTKRGLPERRCAWSRIEVEFNGKTGYGDWQEHCWDELSYFSLYNDDVSGSGSIFSDFNIDGDFGGYGGGVNGGGGDPTPQPAESETSPKIIKDQSFQESKADCIFEKMRMQSPDFKKSIQKFDGDFPVAHLKFSLAELDSSKNARTFPPDNYVIEIKINELYLNNRPNLDIARTFAHEVIHAELYRKMLSLAQNGKLPGSNSNQEIQVKYIESMRDNFPGLYDYYQARNPDGKEDWDHNMMGEHYRNAIIDVLKKYDPNQTKEFYDALSWEGLKGTVSWKALKEDERKNFNNILSDFLKKGGEECK